MAAEQPKMSSRGILSLLARAAPSGLIKVERASEVLGEDRKTASNLLGRLHKQGWIRRVRRGLYLVLPLESDPTRETTVEDPWILARELFAPCYIGGWSAAEYWGLTEQLFRSTFVATAANVRGRASSFLGAEFVLAQIGHPRLIGSKPVWRGQERVAVSDLEGTVADALTAPWWVGGVRHLAEILQTYFEHDNFDEPALLARLEAQGSGAAFKRLGFLAERLRPEAQDLIEASLARRTAGISKLDPDVEGPGRIHKRWGLRVNVAVRGSRS